MKKFLIAFLILGTVHWSLVTAHAAGPVSHPAGSNLTSFNGSIGVMNNNAWNAMMNPRGAPTADFGNCNALILRCASPKCATGGCTTMEIAYPIVAGCVASNENCRTHGDELTQYIAAQLVANSTARANDAAANAAAAAQNAATATADAQVAAMQQQMQQIQAQMATANAQNAAALQRALDEQRALIQAQSVPVPQSPVPTTPEPVVAEQIASAVEMGVSSDVLVRKQISGQILEQLENAEVALAALKKTMQNTFDYAGCDNRGNNCTGPKRVRAFKQKAGEFFEPYEVVLDEVYDALIMAQSLGVDITDVYMMLNGSCNVWGKYMCQKCPSNNPDCGGNGYYEVATVVDPASGISRVDPRQPNCTLMQMLTSQDEIQQNWLDMAQGSSGGIRVACASDAIESSTLFRNRKKQSMISIETLQRIIDQDAPMRIESGKNATDLTRFCSVTDDDVSRLQVLTQRKTLTGTAPGWGRVCVTERQLEPKGEIIGNFASLDCMQTLQQDLAEDLAACKNYGDRVSVATCEESVRTANATAVQKCLADQAAARDNCRKNNGVWSGFSASCQCPESNPDCITSRTTAYEK